MVFILNFWEKNLTVKGQGHWGYSKVAAFGGGVLSKNIVLKRKHVFIDCIW
jgi:hypothetical protein